MTENTVTPSVGSAEPDFVPAARGPFRTSAFDELLPRERLRFWWAFCWRGLVISACGFAGGFIAGFLLGFFASITMAMLGYDTRAPGPHLVFKILGGAAGLGVGLVLSYQYVRWVFRARLAGFRLVLARES